MIWTHKVSQSALIWIFSLCYWLPTSHVIVHFCMFFLGRPVRLKKHPISSWYIRNKPFLKGLHFRYHFSNFLSKFVNPLFKIPFTHFLKRVWNEHVLLTLLLSNEWHLSCVASSFAVCPHLFFVFFLPTFYVIVHYGLPFLDQLVLLWNIRFLPSIFTAGRHFRYYFFNFLLKFVNPLLQIPLTYFLKSVCHEHVLFTLLLDKDSLICLASHENESWNISGHTSLKNVCLPHYHLPKQ